MVKKHQEKPHCRLTDGLTWVCLVVMVAAGVLTRGSHAQTAANLAIFNSHRTLQELHDVMVEQNTPNRRRPYSDLRVQAAGRLQDNLWRARETIRASRRKQQGNMEGEEEEVIEDADEPFSTPSKVQKRHDNSFQRDLKGSSKESDSSPTTNESKSSCKAAEQKLERCVSRQINWLYVQRSLGCSFRREEAGEDGQYAYYVDMQEVDPDTYGFSDRPYRLVEKITSLFFAAGFDIIYGKQSSIRKAPNAAITFATYELDNGGEIIGVFEGPVIAILVESAVVHLKNDGKLDVSYLLAQSQDQESFVSISALFDGKERETEQLFSCSYFLDPAEGTGYEGLSEKKKLEVENKIKDLMSNNQART